MKVKGTKAYIGLAMAKVEIQRLKWVAAQEASSRPVGAERAHVLSSWISSFE